MMNHVFVRSEQDGCECDGFVQVDKGLDRQIDRRKCGVTDNCVTILYVVVVNDLLMSEKEVTVRRMFLYVVSVEITS